ncbi:MAG: steroid delta-isomerase, partial [Muriicola sp.]
EYNWLNEDSRLLLKDLKVGYHLWYSPDILVSAVLVDNRMDLVVSNLKDGTNYTFQKNVGRSLHKIPNSELISFISNEGDGLQIKSMDPLSGATKFLAARPPGVQDICWLINGTILAGKDNLLIGLSPEAGESQWKVLTEFPKNKITNISRITANAISGKLALVAEIPSN